LIYIHQRHLSQQVLATNDWLIHAL
jgi:hypothetical protein